MTLVEPKRLRRSPAGAVVENPMALVRSASGKFFFVGEQKLFIKGVTYGPFPEGSHGARFHNWERSTSISR